LYVLKEAIRMRLYNTDLPEAKPENAQKIIEKCRDIHQLWINGRTRNTKMQKWDTYWVKAYNVVLKVLDSRGQSDILALGFIGYLVLIVVVVLCIF